MHIFFCCLFSLPLNARPKTFHKMLIFFIEYWFESLSNFVYSHFNDTLRGITWRLFVDGWVSPSHLWIYRFLARLNDRYRAKMITAGHVFPTIWAVFTVLAGQNHRTVEHIYNTMHIKRHYPFIWSWTAFAHQKKRKLSATAYIHIFLYIPAIDIHNQLFYVFHANLMRGHDRLKWA